MEEDNVEGDCVVIEEINDEEAVPSADPEWGTGGLDTPHWKTSKI